MPNSNNNLRVYLRDFRQLDTSLDCKEMELIDYSARQIKTLLKSRLIEKLQGANQINVDELWKVIEEL